MTAPFMLGFYRVEPFQAADDTATVAALHGWCQREGYVLGVPYREEGSNGAFESMLESLLGHEDVAGVVMSDLDQLGPDQVDRTADIVATGKGLYVIAEPAEGSP